MAGLPRYRRKRAELRTWVHLTLGFVASLALLWLLLFKIVIFISSLPLPVWGYAWCYGSWAIALFFVLLTLASIPVYAKMDLKPKEGDRNNRLLPLARYAEDIIIGRRTSLWQNRRLRVLVMVLAWPVVIPFNLLCGLFFRRA